MKLMFRLPLFHLLLCCATQALGVQINSVPNVNNEGVIQTELKDPVSLVCELDSSHEPQADNELVWKRNNAVVNLKEGNKENRSSVCIIPIYEDDGAIFTCHQKENTTVSRSVTLSVTYPPLLNGSEKVTVEEEAVLRLTCNIQANPLISNVTWTLNGSQVDLVESDLIVINNGLTSQLSADFVRRSLHEGTYRCSAVSPKYSVFTKTFFVTVTDKTMKFPLYPIIAGVVVVVLTAILAVASRWKKIAKCCRQCCK